MNLFEQFGTDTTLEKEGVYIEYGRPSDEKKVRFKIARAGGANAKYLKVLEQKTKPLRHLIQKDLVGMAESDEIMAEVFAEAVVLGWENVTEKDGTPIPFTRDNCISLFRRLPDLFADIRTQATQSAIFRSAVLESDAKNS